MANERRGAKKKNKKFLGIIDISGTKIEITTILTVSLGGWLILSSARELLAERGYTNVQMFILGAILLSVASYIIELMKNNT